MRTSVPSRRAPRRRLALLIAVPAMAATIGTGAIATSAEGATVFKDTYSVELPVTNPCTGENVTLTGTAHEEYHASDDGTHGTYHLNWSGVSGTGDLGNTYRATSSDIETINTQAAYTTTYAVTTRLISQGSAPNFTVRDQLHLTVNADGTTTSFHDNVSADPDCKG